MNRPATASLHSATPKKKCSLLFGFARDRFFLKKERTFFLWCSALQVFGQVAGLMRTRFCENYFLGKGFRKTLGYSFLNSEVASGGGGVWGGILRLLRFFLLAKFGWGFWRLIESTYVLTIVCSTKVSKCVYYSYQHEKRNFTKIWRKGKRGKVKTKSFTGRTCLKSWCSPHIYWND